MKTFDDDKMNYDENGYYPDEIGKNGKGKTSIAEKLFGYGFMAYFLICILAIVLLSGREGNGYKVILIFVHLFAVFGITGLISDAVKKEKLNVPCLVISICGILGVAVIFAYKDGSDDTKAILMRIGIFLFFMLFIIIGAFVVVSDIRSSRGNAERCTVSVTAQCVSVSTSSVSKNGKISAVYYNPTYKYTYEGTEYKSGISNVTELRENGMEYDIMIDPDDPKVIYEPDSIKNHSFAILFGCMFILMPLIMMIFVFTFVKF